MSDYDLILRAGRVHTNEGFRVQDLGISEGKIAGIGEALFGSCDAEVDVSDYLILPGAIDTQVCLQAHGMEARTAFSGGSTLLAAGGVSAYFELPFYAEEPAVTPSIFNALSLAAERHGFLDYGIWAGITESNLEDLEEFDALGAVGFAARLAPGGTLPEVDDCVLFAAMQRAVDLNQIVGVLAENASFPARLMPPNPSVEEYLAAHPVVAELEAVQRAIILAYESGCSLHLFSVTSPRSLELIANARTQGVDVSCSVTPHHLFLNEEDCFGGNTRLKSDPVLRSESDRALLLEQFQSGVIDIFASDHIRKPTKADESWLDAPVGLEGGETALRMLLSADEAESAAEIVARTFSENVARRFLLHPEKGVLAEGSDADLVIIDPNIQPILEKSNIHSDSPFLGRRAGGVVLYTFTRGLCVYGRGKFNELEPKQIRPKRE